jgi:glycosyltransferase involved in cell wall biosynthesis
MYTILLLDESGGHPRMSRRKTITPPNQSIGLAMICRDEAEWIERCLESVKPYISTWTIVDTGSEDNTPELVETLLKDIPGTLHHSEWVNHKVNRSQLLAMAHDTADYLMLLDADTILHMDGPLPLLVADEYIAMMGQGFRQSFPFLLNGRLEGWRYEGVVHSYLVIDHPISSAVLEGVRLEEMRSASPRADKIQQDAVALEAEIDPRTVFYLAQTYRDLGHYEEAADLYRLRIRHTASHPQEVFWSCYQEGLIRLEASFERGIAVLLEAYQRRPTRAEPLWKVAREYRMKGFSQVALLFAEKAATIPMPDDNHFVLSWVYEWGALYERAVCREITGNVEGAVVDYLELVMRGGEGAGHAQQRLDELGRDPA